MMMKVSYALPVLYMLFGEAYQLFSGGDHDHYAPNNVERKKIL